MSDAMIGYQTKYRIRSLAGSTAPFTDVGEVYSVTPGEATADRVDVTHYQSPGRRREYISGLIDSGEASFELNWVPGSPSDKLLRGLFKSGEVRDHQIEFPNGVTVTFGGVLTGYSKELPVDDKMSATVTVAVSGDEEWSDAA